MAQGSSIKMPKFLLTLTLYWVFQSHFKIHCICEKMTPYMDSKPRNWPLYRRNVLALILQTLPFSIQPTYVGWILGIAFFLTFLWHILLSMSNNLSLIGQGFKVSSNAMLSWSFSAMYKGRLIFFKYRQDCILASDAKFFTTALRLHKNQLLEVVTN